MTKTIAQLIEEHQNRRKIPEFSTIVFDSSRTYHNVTNFVEEEGRFPGCEFDSEWNGTITHVVISSLPATKETFVEESPGYTDIIAKECSKVTIYRNTDDSEDYTNIQNLKENRKDGTVEFDCVIGDKKSHIKMYGKITKYIATLPTE